MHDPTSADESPRPLLVAGRYAVDTGDLLGAGGMSLVYRGRDIRTRREVALKTLRPEFGRDAETRIRFRREARTLALLSHPNVVKVYDLIEDEESAWAVMELIEGQTLRELVEEEGPLGIEETAFYLDQIALALQHLHAQGIVHLDVKPHNVVLQEDGSIKLVDFGLAQPAGEPQELLGGATFGTAAYIAPEQATGDAVDATTDVYALGCVVYELLTGRPPFAPDDDTPAHAIVRAHIDLDPTPPGEVAPERDLPPWVDTVVLGALAKRPRDRYRDAITFARTFRAAMRDSAATGDPRLFTEDIAPERESVLLPPRKVRGDGRGREQPISIRRHRVVPLVRTRRMLWYALIAMLALDLVLALVVFATHGELPGLSSRPSSLSLGVVARPLASSVVLRAAPSIDAEALDTIGLTDRPVIAGAATIAGDEVWWPISFSGPGSMPVGYVRADLIEPAQTGIGGWLQHLTDHLRTLAL
jgi:serine/threonine protein kinase